MIIAITVLTSFAAGYLLRGLLAVALERKRQRHPLSMLSDHLLRGLTDIADRYATHAAGEASRALLAELQRRSRLSCGLPAKQGDVPVRVEDLAAAMPEIFNPTTHAD